MTGVTKYQTPGLGASAVLTALRSPMARGLREHLSEVRYQAARSGRRIALPVMYARDADRVVVCVGHAEEKTWWRNFRTARALSMWLDGRWRDGIGRVAAAGSPEHDQAAALYRQAHPRVKVSASAPYVVVELGVDESEQAQAAPPGRTGLWRRWFTSVTLGELLGFAAPAVTGALVYDLAPIAAVPALLAAGLIEGSVLGWFQARVLRSVLPGFPSRHWVVATALGALLAWSIGSVPVATDGLGDWPAGLLWPAVVTGGAVMLLSLGIAQWLVLRRVLAGARLWILATVLAWLGGLTAFFAITSPLWHEGQSGVLIAAIGLLGGLVMAAVMAAITGAFLVRIVDRKAPVER